MRANKTDPMVCIFTSARGRGKIPEQFAREATSLDKVIRNTARAWSGGVLKEWHYDYKLGDSFQKIEITSLPDDSFKVVFYPKADAVPFYKDLMVLTIMSIKQTGAKIKSMGRIKL